MRLHSGIAALITICGVLFVAGCEPKQEPLPTGPSMPAAPPSGPPASGGPAAAANRPKTPPVDMAVLKIKNALATQKQRLPIKDLKVDVKGSVITLRGVVKSEYIKNQAGNVAGPQTGGLPFINELTVSEAK